MKISKKSTIDDVNLGVVAFYGFYIVLSMMMAIHVRNGWSDFNAHNRWAENILVTGFDFSNLYHNFTAFVMLLLGAEVHIAAGIVVFVMQMFLLAMVHYFVHRELHGIVSDKWILVTIAVTTVAGSMPNIWVAGHILYFYAFGLNIWHNPTTYTVMPFVVITFFLFCYCIKAADVPKTERVASPPGGGG
ncbi:MAG: hypothetical protein FWG68_00505, partial [Defluviitaleaceae bacterium]|nr:hypothetical protein [Defluviitaleaceae bacterium]